MSWKLSMDAIWILRGRWFGGVGFFFNFFFLLYVIFSVFSFKHRGVSGLLSHTTSDQQEKSQFGGFLARVPQWKRISEHPAEGRLSWLSPGRLAAAAAEPQDWPDTRTEGESKGEGKLHAWFCRQNESPGSARASFGAKGLTASGFITGAD